MMQLHIAFFLLLVFFFVPRVSWWVSPLVDKAYYWYPNVILVSVGNLSVFTFARLRKLIVEWRSSLISWGPLSLPNIINFEGALILDEFSYRPQIGRISKRKDNPLKWDQSEVCSFIRLEAVLF